MRGCSNSACSPRRSATGYIPGSPSRKFSFSNWSGPSAGPRRCRGRIFDIWQKLAAALPGDRSRQMGASDRFLAACWRSRRPNKPTCPASKFARSTQPASGAAPQERDRHYPVTYVEPLEGNEQTVGFDLLSEPGRKAAVEHAITRAKSERPRQFGSSSNKASSAASYCSSRSRTGRTEAGIVSVALRMATFTAEIAAALRGDARCPACRRGARLRRSTAGFPASAGPPPTGMPSLSAGAVYRVETEPTAAYVEQHRGWQSWAVLVAGVISTGLLGALLLLGTGYTRRIETVVDERTRDLETATGACSSKSRIGSRRKPHCGRRKGWRRSGSSRAALRTISTIC